ncbi:MAG: hypothetical protein ACYCYO_09845 [Bacilli bacterium]
MPLLKHGCAELASAQHTIPAKRVFQQLMVIDGKGGIVPADVKLIGIVVAGTSHALMALQGKFFVKASVLGAIANPY